MALRLLYARGLWGFPRERLDLVRKQGRKNPFATAVLRTLLGAACAGVPELCC